MESAAQSRCPWLFQLLADPRLESLRSHPKFAGWESMLERMESAAEKRLAQDR